MPENQFASSHYVSNDLGEAISQSANDIRTKMNDAPIDLLIAFVAGYESADMDRHLADIRTKTSSSRVIGCSCESLIANGLELENEKAVSFWAASFSQGSAQTMHLKYERLPDGAAFVGWPDDFNAASIDPETDCVVLLGEPFEFPADILLEQMNDDYPGLAIAGGMASGAYQPGTARLIHNDTIEQSGAVAVLLKGVPLATVVSQGCRPIGQPRVITAAERNVIQRLGGKSAFEELQSVFSELPTRDQRLVQNGLHVGRVMSEYQDEFKYGDFLIRNVIAMDQDEQTIAIGDYVRPGQTVQFHLRDAESASAELEQLLVGTKETSSVADPKSALLFTCNGRGLNLFPDPHHDAAMVQSKCGNIPAAGFFAAGEIGPVGGRNFLHGFTASVVLFG